MAERTLLRRGHWFPVPDGVDDATAAAVLNPGGAAWKTVVWEGRVAAGQTVLVLGATGASGRIAAQLAAARGARVVAAGRDRRILDELLTRGVDAAVRVDRPHEELAAAIAAEGPYDLVADYLWGAPAEAVFAALPRTESAAIRYVLVGMAAGETANVPALALRRAPVRLAGSGIGGTASIADAAAGYAEVLRRVAAGEIAMDVEPVPLADVESAWPTECGGRRTVFIP
jgi:NADPH2:quinone reductase